MFGTGVRLGRFFGVELRIDWSLLIIFALVVVNLGVGVLPMWHPSWTAFTVWWVATAAATLFFVSVLLHEMSHALVARRVGVEVDGITLFVFGGMAHMRDEPRRPRDEFLIAFVGPLTSIAIAVLSLIAVWLSAGTAFAGATDASAIARAFDDLGPVATILLWLGQVNLLLGIFNLVPGFPLDGGRVLRSFMWAVTRDLEKATRWASNGGRIFAYVLMGYGVLLLFRGGFAQGIWLLLIGWFLNNAALLSYRQLVARRALEGVFVRDVMTRDIAVVPPDLSVDSFVRDRLMASEQRAFPVVENDKLLGLVCLEDVRRAARDQWSQLSVREIMTPREKLITVKLDDEADRVLRLFGEHAVDQLPVLEEEQLLGFVRRGVLLRWLALSDDDKRRKEEVPRRRGQWQHRHA